jgi:PAS domain-containing protein
VQTIVIIGASNVTLSLPVIWSTLCRSLPEPFRLIVAAGHGRSFGLPNTVLGRTLPSILECGLWESLDKLKETSTFRAIVTDVGNDLLYGADADQTMSWVNEAVERLTSQTQHTVVTGLPIDTLQGLSGRRFEFFRRLLFPDSTLTLETALVEGNALHGQLLKVGDGPISTTTPEAKWYGFDPIHIRRRCRRDAWERYLSLCIQENPLRCAGPVADLSVWKSTAERRWKRSRLLTSQQPALVKNGNELWLF